MPGMHQGSHDKHHIVSSSYLQDSIPTYFWGDEQAQMMEREYSLQSQCRFEENRNEAHSSPSTTPSSTSLYINARFSQLSFIEINVFILLKPCLVWLFSDVNNYLVYACYHSSYLFFLSTNLREGLNKNKYEVLIRCVLQYIKTRHMRVCFEF